MLQDRSIRRPDAAQAAGIYRGRRPHARARHRRDSRALQPRAGRAPHAAALPRSGSPGARPIRPSGQPASGADRGNASTAVDGLAEAGDVLRRHCGVRMDVQLPDRLRGQRLARGHGRDARLLPRRRRAADAGARVHRGRHRAAGRRDHSRVRLLATPLQRRSPHHRKDDSHESARHAADGCWRHATRRSLSAVADRVTGAQLQRERRGRFLDARRSGSAAAEAIHVGRDRPLETRRDAGAGAGRARRAQHAAGAGRSRSGRPRAAPAAADR